MPAALALGASPMFKLKSVLLRSFLYQQTQGASWPARAAAHPFFPDETYALFQ
jgi:hypothetical protein